LKIKTGRPTKSNFNNRDYNKYCALRGEIHQYCLLKVQT
jgi:hypothetical protein